MGEAASMGEAARMGEAASRDEAGETAVSSRSSLCSRLNACEDVVAMADRCSEDGGPAVGKDACRRVRKTLCKASKRKDKQWNVMLKLMTKLGVEGQTLQLQQGNPICALNNLCLKNRWKLPEYTKVQDSPAQVKCVFMDRVVVGSGSNRIAAKQDAARQILDILET
ncbi:uncharacterized protein LOC134533260 isoform X2 [Bacillus rossius redtenbacheri]